MAEEKDYSFLAVKPKTTIKISNGNISIGSSHFKASDLDSFYQIKLQMSERVFNLILIAWGIVLFPFAVLLKLDFEIVLAMYIVPMLLVAIWGTVIPLIRGKNTIIFYISNKKIEVSLANEKQATQLIKTINDMLQVNLATYSTTTNIESEHVNNKAVIIEMEPKGEKKESVILGKDENEQSTLTTAQEQHAGNESFGDDKKISIELTSAQTVLPEIRQIQDLISEINGFFEFKNPKITNSQIIIKNKTYEIRDIKNTSIKNIIPDLLKYGVSGIGLFFISIYLADFQIDTQDKVFLSIMVIVLIGAFIFTGGYALNIQVRNYSLLLLRSWNIKGLKKLSDLFIQAAKKLQANTPVLGLTDNVESIFHEWEKLTVTDSRIIVRKEDIELNPFDLKGTAEDHISYKLRRSFVPKISPQYTDQEENEMSFPLDNIKDVRIFTDYDVNEYPTYQVIVDVGRKSLTIFETWDRSAAEDTESLIKNIMLKATKLPHK